MLFTCHQHGHLLQEQKPTAKNGGKDRKNSIQKEQNKRMCQLPEYQPGVPNSLDNNKYLNFSHQKLVLFP